MKSILKVMTPIVFIALSQGGYAAGIFHASHFVLENPTFVYQASTQKDVKGNLAFRLPCYQCPRSLKVTEDTLITDAEGNILNVFLQPNTNYQTHYISYKIPSLEAQKISLKSTNGR